MTVVINLIGSPSSGKSVLGALIFAELKKRNCKVELVQEWIKEKIWKGETDILNNVHYIASKQFELIRSLDNKLDYIVLDTSLVNNLYYNRYNKNNVSDVEKTERDIKYWLSTFSNVYIFVKRNKMYTFEQEGRIHTEAESLVIESELLDLVDSLGIDYIYTLSTTNYSIIHELCNKIIEK